MPMGNLPCKSWLFKDVLNGIKAGNEPRGVIEHETLSMKEKNLLVAVLLTKVSICGKRKLSLGLAQFKSL